MATSNKGGNKGGNGSNGKAANGGNGKAAKGKAPEIGVNSHVTFLGYGDDVPQAERMLEKGAVYPVIELTENGYVVRFANPEFDKTKDENPDTNPATLETEVFKAEVALAETPADAPQVAVAKSTKVKAGKTPKIPAAKPAKAAKEPAAAKPPKVEKEEIVLAAEQEDPDVLAIVNESTDLVATAQDLEGNIAKNEYHLGGVLYHIRKDKKYQELNPAYKEVLGWQQFLDDYFNVDYRKAMNLIDIYITFSTAGIENPAETVAKLGWTKASKITGPMRVEGAVADDLIKLAEENTVRDLQIAIKEQTAYVGGNRGTPVQRLTIKFRYEEAEAKHLMALIESAKTAHALADNEAALAFIIEDWATMQQPAAQAAAPKQAAPVGTKQPKAGTKPKAVAASSAAV